MKIYKILTSKELSEKELDDIINDFNKSMEENIREDRQTFINSRDEVEVILVKNKDKISYKEV